MHTHSPYAWQLAVPGIGFPQHISVGPIVPDLAMPGEALTRWPSVACISMVKRLIQTTLTVLSSVGR